MKKFLMNMLKAAILEKIEEKILESLRNKAKSTSNAVDDEMVKEVEKLVYRHFMR